MDPPFKGTLSKSGWKTHHFGTTLKGGNFFHLVLLRHNHIKTSLNFLKENHWARPFFALFSSVREKLQLTVSLNHPVSSTIPLWILWFEYFESWNFQSMCCTAPKKMSCIAHKKMFCTAPNYQVWNKMCPFLAAFMQHHNPVCLKIFVNVQI